MRPRKPPAGPRAYDENCSFLWETDHAEAATFLLKLVCGEGGVPTGTWANEAAILAVAQIRATLAAADDIKAAPIGHECPDGATCPTPKACWGETACLRAEANELTGFPYGPLPAPPDA